MRVLASGHPELLPEVDPEVIAQHTVDAEHAGLMRRLSVRSHLAVPLTLGERIVGAISMAYVGVRRYGPDDVPLIEALASRAAVAIEHARLYRDAETARTEAQEANRAKDHFLAMLGHELRNPLAPIVTALRLMRLKPPGSTDREQDMIERQVRHMSRLVDDLMDVSRITQGKIELERAVVMLDDVVARALEMAGPLIEQRRHRLSVDVEPGLQVEGDAMRLAQVLSNLLTNAARYTDPGGEIRLSAVRTAGGKLRLAVADTGSGIDPSLLARVFEPFVQGPRGPDRAGGGLGIGLALVKSLVQLHGGSVDAKSGGPGKGSEFVVLLPALS
jgi:signal transduction histidine kinase